LLFVKGAPEELLPRARWIDIDGRREPLSAECVDVVVQAATAMADRGLRVLAFAYRVLPTDYALAEAEADVVVTALAGFEDPPRPEVPDAVRRCQTAGIRIIMVTGDHPRTALAVARKIGLVRSPDPRLLTGAALGRMSDTEILFALDAPELVCARVTADQKLRVVTLLQRKRYIVAVTGDGVNDAPALRAADIGIAMGRSGTDVAREASDMVLLDDNFASIVEAIEEGRTFICARVGASRFSRVRFLGNRLITAGIVAELVLIVLIDYTAAGQTLFGTAPIGLVSWDMILPFAVGMLILEELRKVIVRRTQVTG
jgi:sodium/potassium-transporting ATPase subunit alpha